MSGLTVVRAAPDGDFEIAADAARSKLMLTRLTMAQASKFMKLGDSIRRAGWSRGVVITRHDEDVAIRVEDVLAEDWVAIDTPESV